MVEKFVLNSEVVFVKADEMREFYWNYLEPNQANSATQVGFKNTN